MESASADSEKEQKIDKNLFNKAQVIGVSFLELAQAAASSVGRILDNMKIWLGTGFMISGRLLMTNNHVIPDSKKAIDSLIEFNYELDAVNAPKAVTRFALAPNDFFMSSPEDDLDFTIVALGDRVLGEGKISDFGYCPLFDGHSKKFYWANIIHHPQGNFKQITISQNKIVAWNHDVLQYYAKTDVGSSGAPVFNKYWEPIALHHWGAPTRRAFTLKGKLGPKDTKEGIRISAIIKRVNSKKYFLNQKQRSLIDAALACPFRHPSLLENHC